jgi:hypothetical protein
MSYLESWHSERQKADKTVRQAFSVSNGHYRHYGMMHAFCVSIDTSRQRANPDVY